MTLVIGPILLVLLLQIRFLPYHYGPITWTHRLALLADLLLIWCLWRKILSGRGDFRRWRRWTSWALGIVLSIAAFLFSWIVATFPGEWREWPLSFVPSSFEPAPLNTWLFAGGKVKKSILHHPESWLSNTLVFQQSFNLYEALKIDDPKKVEWRDHLFSMRRRDLKGAEFALAALPKVDFEDAQLQGAALDGANLQGASLRGAHLQGATFHFAKLQGATLDQAHLQGAWLDGDNYACVA